MRLFGFEISRPTKLETRDTGISGLVNPEDWLLQALLGRVASATGITVTPLRMMGVSTVFACIRIRSTILASLPCILYKGDGKGGRIEARGHPLYSLLRDAPNMEMSAYDFFATMEGHEALRQNAFAEIMRDSDGDPNGLYPIDPMDITVMRDPRTMKLHFKFMRNGTDFDLADILHVRGYSRSGLVGIDHSASLQEVFALALALQDNAAKFFGNGSRPSGILEHPASLSAEAQERLRNQVEQSTGGRNTYRTMVLEEGLKYNATRSENKDSQFQEAREYQDLQICRIFGVPPHKVAILQGSPRANIEEENISFVQDTMRPICINYEQQLNMKLLTDEERGQGYEFLFNMDVLMRGNMATRFEAYASGILNGVFSVNEARQREGMNPVEHGDTHLQPLNAVPLGTPAPDPSAGAEDEVDENGDPVKPKVKAKPAAAPAVPAPGSPDDGNPDPSAQLPEKKLIPVLLKKPKEIAVIEDASILRFDAKEVEDLELRREKLRNFR